MEIQKLPILCYILLVTVLRNTADDFYDFSQDKIRLKFCNKFLISIFDFSLQYSWTQILPKSLIWSMSEG